MKALGDDVGEVVEGFGACPAARFHQHELAEIAESSGAFGGDAMVGECHEYTSQRGVDLIFRGRVVGEGLKIREDVFVEIGLRRLGEFGRQTMRAAEAVEGRVGGKRAAASIGVGKIAMFERGFGALRRHAGKYIDS